jgi:hypothetical protein
MKGMNFDAGSVVLGSVLGVAAGGVLSYLLCKRAFDERLDGEVATLKAHYQSRASLAEPHVKDDHSLERSASAVGNVWKHAIDIEELEDAAPGDDAKSASEDGSGESVDEPEPEPESYSADGGSESADVAPDGHVAAADEVRPTEVRDTSKPYVISQAEFFEESPEGYSQVTVTYYAGDHVLIDEKEDQIRGIDKTVGKLNDKVFGGISEDPNVRYVRNDKLQVDFEILLDKREYTDAILNYGTLNLNQNRR